MVAAPSSVAIGPTSSCRRRWADVLPRLVALIALAAAAAGCGASDAGTAGIAAPAAALAAADRLAGEGRVPAAQGAYRRALHGALAAGDRDVAAAALLGLGDCLDPLAETARTRRLYARAAAVADGLAEGRAGPLRARAAARLLFVEGVAAVGRDEVAAAEPLLARALAALPAGDARFRGRLLRAQGNIALLQGRPARAERSYRASLAVCTAAGDRRGILGAVQSLGDVWSARGETGPALRAYRRALREARALGDRDRTAYLLNAIGTVQLDRSEYRQAEASLRASLAAGSQRLAERGYALNNLGIVLGMRGGGGLGHFERALVLLERAGDRREALRVRGNLGACYFFTGELDRAERQFRGALAEARRIGEVAALPAASLNLGALAEARGRFGEAESWYRSSLRQATAVADRIERARALAALAHLALLRGDTAGAVRAADQAARLAAESGEREIFWRARTDAGRALARRGERRQARRALEAAALTVEQLRRQQVWGDLSRQLFFAARLEPFDALVELHADAGDAAGALAAAERAKGRVLREVLARQGPARGPLAGAGGSTPAEAAREAELRQRLADANQQLFLAELAGAREARRQGGELAAARGELAAFLAERLAADRPARRLGRHEAPAPAPADLAPWLAGGRTALLEFALLEGRSLLFVLTAAAPGGGGGGVDLRVYRLPAGRAELGRRVDAFRQQLAARDPGFEAAALELYRALLAPAAGQLAGHDLLAIVPDGALWNLPFQALAPAPGATLLDRHALALLPALALLSGEAAAADGAAPRPIARPLLAFGDPAPPTPPGPAAGPALPRLPHAAGEVAALARLYGPASRAHTGAAASEAAFKEQAGGFRVLHLATHGILDDRAPLFSSLVLARRGPDDPEDGQFEAWELLDRELPAELVVLSACQTGRGRQVAGEGLIGLSWAFLAAGGRAVVASQWEVDSAATAPLMVGFHRRARAGAGAPAALRGAALALRRDPRYRHPFYWAGFVVVASGAGGAAALNPAAASGARR